MTSTPIPIQETIAQAHQLITELQKQNQRTLTPEETQQALTIAKTLNISIQKLQTLKFSHLRTLENILQAESDCKKCINPFNCTKKQKISAEITDTDILTKYIDCPKYLQARIEKTLASARIPKIFQNITAQNDFHITKGNLNAAKIANESVLNNKGVYFYGNCGVGKTMLACIIANERAKRNKPSLFITITDLFYELNPYHYEENQKYLIPQKRKLLRESPCLIIDDLGAEKSSQWTRQTLFDIIDYRYKENLQTIITSNFSIDSLSKRLTDYEGDRIIRRIKAISTPVYMEYH